MTMPAGGGTTPGNGAPLTAAATQPPGGGVRPLLPPSIDASAQGATARAKASGTAIGKVEGTRTVNAPQAAANMRSLEIGWGTVNKTIDDVLGTNGKPGMVDWKNTGFIGSLSNAVPGTPAYNLARALETIKANIGFNKLQQMRANSPTGGALGQVSDFENRLLAAVQGSLDQGQTAGQLRQHLLDIRANLAALQHAQIDAFQKTYPGVDINAADTPPPLSGQYTRQQLEEEARRRGLVR